MSLRHNHREESMATEGGTEVTRDYRKPVALFMAFRTKDSIASSIDSDSEQNNFLPQKSMIEAEQRRECLPATERIFGNDFSEGDFIAINFFA